MRIAIIVPFGENSTRMSSKKYAQRLHANQPEVETIFAGKIIPGETSSDLAEDFANFIDAIKAAEADGFDAVIPAPYPDAGIEEARELVRIPVLGPLQVALHMGLILGYRVCVITANRQQRRWVQYRIRAYGLEHMVTVRTVDMSVEEVLPYYEEYLKSGIYGEPLDRLVSVGIKAIEEDDATVLTIGCGGIAWLVDAAEEKLKEKGYDIPFINPHLMAVEVAKALVNLRKSHSRACYPGYKWDTVDGKPKHI